MYADDLKIFTTIHSLNDTVNLQNDLDILHSWCVRNELKLNINKCKFMPFTNRHVSLCTEYRINSQVLERVNFIKDLGVTFDSKLRFDIHINNTVNKGYRMLGFVTRITKDFTNIKCLNMLYNSLVRSHLEYCAVVWNPHHTTRIHKIERVQKKFTRHVWFKLRKPYDDYGSRLHFLKMFSLEIRRNYIDFCSLHSMVHDLSSGLSNKLSYKQGQRTNRREYLFEPEVKRTDFGRFVQPTTRIQFNYINDIKNQSMVLTFSRRKYIKELKRDIFIHTI